MKNQKEIKAKEIETIPVRIQDLVKDAIKQLLDEIVEKTLSQYEIKTLNEKILSCVILDGITDAYEQDKWKLQAMATLKGMNIEHDSRFEEAEQVCDKILKTKPGQKFLKELNFQS